MEDKREDKGIFDIRSISDVFWLILTLIFIFPFIPFLAALIIFD